LGALKLIDHTYNVKKRPCRIAKIAVKSCSRNSYFS
ncbi:MAG: hypothetical protein ACI8WA_000742, partial [Polaribacter sp.]